MEDLVKLTVRTFNDIIPPEVDAHFLYSQTPDNEQSVVEAALKVNKWETTDNWLIMDTKAMSGYEGFNVFKKSLVNAGLDNEQIQGVYSNEDMLHTLIESLAAVKHCKEHGYNSLLISAAPFQQLRAFMTAITATERLYPNLKVYSLAGTAYSWNEQVTHSQGKTIGTRDALIDGEIKRIGFYGEKGDLLKVPEVLDYLNRRD